MDYCFGRNLMCHIDTFALSIWIDAWTWRFHIANVPNKKHSKSLNFLFQSCDPHLSVSVGTEISFQTFCDYFLCAFSKCILNWLIIWNYMEHNNDIIDILVSPKKHQAVDTFYTRNAVVCIFSTTIYIYIDYLDSYFFFLSLFIGII